MGLLVVLSGRSHDSILSPVLWEFQYVEMNSCNGMQYAAAVPHLALVPPISFHQSLTLLLLLLLVLVLGIVFPLSVLLDMVLL